MVPVVAGRPILESLKDGLCNRRVLLVEQNAGAAGRARSVRS